jgi:hypothetical protein
MAQRRRLALTLALLFAGTFLSAPTATASDATTQIAPQTVRVQLKSAPTRLDAAGRAHVVMWTKCSPDLFLFEIDVSVVQGDNIGQVTLLRGTDELPVCDGLRHRFVVTVAPDQGTFHNGVARIGVFVGAFDAANDADLEATDEVRVKLRSGC